MRGDSETSVDRRGFTLCLETAEGMKGTRFNFPYEVRTTQETRQVLVEMVRQSSEGNSCPPAKERNSGFRYSPKTILHNLSDESGFLMSHGRRVPQVKSRRGISYGEWDT